MKYISPDMSVVDRVLSEQRLIIVESPTWSGKTHWAVEAFSRDSFIFHEDDITSISRKHSLDLSVCKPGQLYVVDEDFYISEGSLDGIFLSALCDRSRFVVLTQSVDCLRDRSCQARRLVNDSNTLIF